MELKLTKEQELAIGKKGCEIVISAAAGSGKTFVLVERVIDYILNKGCSIENLLMVTFTIKAASEMRERILSRLNTELEKEPDNIWLFKQSILISKAKICTIDAFYSSLVKSYFNFAGVSPDFKIGQEAEMKLMKLSVLKDVLERFYTLNDTGFIALAENFTSGRSDNALVELILQMHKEMQHQPFPDKWLDNIVDMYKTDIQDRLFMQKASTIFINELKTHIHAYDRCLKAATDVPELYEKLFPLLNGNYMKMIELLDLLGNGLWDEARDAMSSITFERFVVSGYTDHPIKLDSAEARDSFKKFIEKSNNGIMCVSSVDYINDIKYMQPMMKALSDVVKEFNAALLEEKKNNNLYSFDDIPHFALRILLHDKDNLLASDIALQLCDEYAEVLIDEYQDTNLIQDAIFTLITDNRKKLFVVGDIKQSIYKFRGACPEVFNGLLARGSMNESEELPQLINLSLNYRSSHGVIDFVNFFFKQTMTEKFGDLEYNENHKLKAYRGINGTDIKTEVYLLDYNKEQIQEEFDSDAAKYEMEAQFVADRINYMIKSGFEIYDKKQEDKRPVRLSDFAILLRAFGPNRKIIDAFLKVFKKAGLDVDCETSENFYDKYEVEFIISLLKIIDNPYNDIPLIAVMKSPVFNFTPDELAQVRINSRQGYFYEALRKISEKGGKYNDFLNKLNFLRMKSKDMPLYKFLSQIYSEYNLFAIFGALDEGKSRQENLYRLCNIALEFENQETKGLYEFICYIDDLTKSESEVSRSNSLTENEKVTILTIHKSKGLEFPICFVSCLGKQFNLNDINQKSILHKEYGFACKIKNSELGVEYKTLQREVIASLFKNEQLSEEQRLLYVAMTRAKEKLILTAAYEQIDKKIKNASNALLLGNTLDIGTLISMPTPGHWLISALLRHPDAFELRRHIDREIETMSEKFDVRIKVINYFSLEKEQEEIVVYPRKKEHISKTSVQTKEMIKNVLDYKYKKSILSTIPQKVSVSELKENFKPDDESKMLIEPDYSRTPEFLREGKSTGLQTGTAVHKVLQYLDFNTKDITQINILIDKLVENEIILKQDTNSVIVEKIRSFLNSEVVNRINSSQKFEKEFRFTAALKITEFTDISPEITKDEKMIIQGVVDCFFVENNELVLIDYKTDYITDEQQLIDRYAVQLNYYAMALEQIYGMRVKEKIIYSLCLEKEILL